MKILIKVNKKVDPSNFKNGDILMFDEKSKEWFVTNKDVIFAEFNQRMTKLEKEQKDFIGSLTEKHLKLVELIENFITGKNNN